MTSYPPSSPAASEASSAMRSPPRDVPTSVSGPTRPGRSAPIVRVSPQKRPPTVGQVVSQAKAAGVVLAGIVGLIALYPTQSRVRIDRALAV